MFQDEADELIENAGWIVCLETAAVRLKDLNVPIAFISGTLDDFISGVLRGTLERT